MCNSKWASSYAAHVFSANKMVAWHFVKTLRRHMRVVSNFSSKFCQDSKERSRNMEIKPLRDLQEGKLKTPSPPFFHFIMYCSGRCCWHKVDLGLFGGHLRIWGPLWCQDVSVMTPFSAVMKHSGSNLSSNFKKNFFFHLKALTKVPKHGAR